MDQDRFSSTTSQTVTKTIADKHVIFRNVQVSKMFGVSEVTVLNWIRASEETKNQLELVDYKGKKCIVNSAHNLAEMQQLSERGRKYRNKVPVKKADISHFGGMRPDHVFEILYNLEFKSRIPYKVAFLRQPEANLERYYNTEMTLDSKYLQAKLLAQDSQQTWSGHLKRDNSVNLIASSFSCPYIYKHFFQDICHKRAVETIKFIGNTEEEGQIFRQHNQHNFEKTVTNASLKTYIADIDSDPLWTILNKNNEETNVVFLLGEAFYNIEFFTRTVRNINSTLTSGDFIITNIYLNNPVYHTDFEAFNSNGSLEVIKTFIDDLHLVQGEDYEFEHVYHDVDATKKWYARTGSKKWNLVMNKEIHFHYSYDGVVKDFIWPKGAKIELANWKLWQEDFPLEAAQLGYSVVSWNTNMEQTEAMVLMQKL
jgi:transposase